MKPQAEFLTEDCLGSCSERKPAPSIMDNLNARVPFKVLPGMASAVKAWKEANKERDMDGYSKMISTLASPETREIGASYMRYEAATGKYRCYNHPLQLIPRALRGHLASSVAGHHVLVLDYSACHLRIAATRLQDPGLLALLESDDPYSHHGKVELISMLNGGGSTDSIRREFPVLAQARDAFERPGESTRVIEGRKVHGNWRTHLAACWSIPEAKAVNWTLSNLHKIPKAKLIMPQFDAFILSVAPEDADSVFADVRDLMHVGMQKILVDCKIKATVGPRWHTEH